MNAREFENVLLNQSIEAVVKQYVFGGSSYVFRSRPQSLDTLRDHLCGRLGTRERNIEIVGSAKIGFSHGPDAFARQFSGESDIIDEVQC